MRVYEFAKQTGTTCATVMRVAEENELDVYSPLSELEAEDIEKLSEGFHKMGVAALRAETRAVAERRRAKAAKAVAGRVAKDRAQAAELESARQRAIAAAEGRPFDCSATAVAVPEDAETPAEEAQASVSEQDMEIKVTLPDLPKVSIEVTGSDDDGEGGVSEDGSDDAEDEADAAADDEEDEEEEDARDYLRGSDLRRHSDGKAQSSMKHQQAQQQKNAQPQKGSSGRNAQSKKLGKASATTAREAAPVAKPAAPKKTVIAVAPPPQRPASTRVGGTRAGFSSVSMRVSRPTAPITIGIGVSPAQPPPPPPKPTISLSVNTREISVRGAIVVKELALKLGIRPNRLIADLMGLKILASINQRVEPDVAAKVAQKYGYKVNVEHARDAANKKPVLKAIDADDEIPQDLPEQMKPRPPVVTFLGHVDHGKTTLMDYIRHAHVAAGEAGGITQQISAYQVDVQGRKITFLDTPGHAAFNAMRQRGAQLTDIAVIIIAADDGIMPQTEEAIKFARQAGVQIMVAITKCDKPTANAQRVKQMLQKAGLTPEEWGGDIVCCEVSGATGQGVPNLLDMILLQADVLELTANPDRRANGYVIEAELEQGFGPTATLLVKGGTLKVGDAILIGEHFGKVRSLIDDRGRRVKEVGPSTPVKCKGLSGVPEAGSEFRVMLDEKRARTLAEDAARARKEQELSTSKAISLDMLMSQMNAADKHELSVVVKSDTQGSLEAIVEALRGIKSEKVSLKIIGTGTGNVSLTDVKSAAAGKAVIIGFDIGCDSGVQQQARHDGVRINSFRIIYELIDHVKKSMLDLLPPEYKELVKGHAVVKAVYDIGKIGKIAGSQMQDGSLLASARYRIIRKGEKVWDGKVQSLRHFKDEVKEVTGQQECGVNFQNYEDFAVGDVIECYALEELPRSL